MAHAHRFRLSLRKLGAASKSDIGDVDLIPTKDIDEMFDAIDHDKSGNLDLGEMRLFLQAMNGQRTGALSSVGWV